SLGDNSCAGAATSVGGRATSGRSDCLRPHRSVRLAVVRAAPGRGPCGDPVSPPETLPVAFRTVGHHRVAGTVRAADLFEVADSLLADGMRLALVSGHDDGASMRAVYLFT